jgi:hypothetical protein
MDRRFTGFFLLYFFINIVCYSQVDTTYLYNPNAPFGPLDIRIAKSPTNYYYLQEGQTFSFRESSPGVKTNTFLDMTSYWDSSPFEQGHLREKNGGDNFIMNYRLLKPVDYNPTFEPGYPIIILMHGFGERANCDDDLCYHADRSWTPFKNTPPAPTDPQFELLNNDHNLLHGGLRHLSAVQRAKGKLPGDASLDDKSFPGFVLFPQNLNGWDQFAVQDAIRILRLLIKKYNIDEDRVYIEGLSNGGHGMYEAIKRAPWLFASAIGMSAIDDGFINVQGMAPAVAHIPLWLFQGGFDVLPSPGKTQRYIQQFRTAGAHVRYTLYPELGHGTWNKAFGEPDFFTWMLGHNKADVHSFGNSSFICSGEGTRLEVAKGFKAYQWQYNGQTIAGADSAVFYAKNPGTYRARFSRVTNPTEAQWNQWSKALTLTVADPPQANIEQIGTVLLKDLNGNENARLQSSGEHAQYYWYKDGTLLDLPGTEDDTLRLATIRPTYGNGAYRLVVSDYGCFSEPSAPKYVFFNDSAPLNINPPTGLQGVSVSPAENTLTWTDASTNEGGFEIWRRRKFSGTTYSPWEMVGLTGANVKTFDDTTVEPTINYQYKIRAVSNTGRSNYVPEGANEGLAVETVVDTEAPAAPTELTATARGIQSLFLTWKPSTDNTRIREYIITYNGQTVSTGAPDTSFMLTDLPLNTEFQMTVKGIDLSRNASPESNVAEANTFFSGLYYEHTTGSWSDLDSVNWEWAEFNGKVSTFTLSPRTQDDYYNFSFDGFILITQAGNYEFRTSSSDGSRLYLDNALLVDNDGIHEFQTAASPMRSLSQGPHRIYVQFFEYTETDSLSVEYKGPDTGNKWMIIPRDVLKSDPSLVTAIGDPDNGPEDSFIVNVYPNPATQDNIHVQVETVMPAPVRVRLLDTMGRSLFEGTFAPDEIVQGVSLSPTGVMNTGLYVITVEQANFLIRKKVIVKRD